MEDIENDEQKFRLGIRITLELNDRLDQLVTDLKKGRPPGQRPSKDSVVSDALEHYIAFMKHDGEEVLRQVEEIITTGTDKTKKILSGCVEECLTKAQRDSARREPKTAG
jgi:predicted DNA-binding protein